MNIYRYSLHWLFAWTDRVFENIEAQIVAIDEGNKYKQWLNEIFGWIYELIDEKHRNTDFVQSFNNSNIRIHGNGIMKRIKYRLFNNCNHSNNADNNSAVGKVSISNQCSSWNYNGIGAKCSLLSNCNHDNNDSKSNICIQFSLFIRSASFFISAPTFWLVISP